MIILHTEYILGIPWENAKMHPPERDLILHCSASYEGKSHMHLEKDRKQCLPITLIGLPCITFHYIEPAVKLLSQAEPSNQNCIDAFLTSVISSIMVSEKS